MSEWKEPQRLEISWGSAWKIGCAVWAVPILITLAILFATAGGFLNLAFF